MSLPILVQWHKLLLLHLIVLQLNIYSHGSQVWRLLDNLLVALEKLLHGGVFCHDALVLEAYAVLFMLLPVSSRFLQGL